MDVNSRGELDSSNFYHPSLSLIPYHPEETFQIVLRHGSSVVVYDRQSKQLSLRNFNDAKSLKLDSCPYCHRSFRLDDCSMDDLSSSSGPPQPSTSSHGHSHDSNDRGSAQFLSPSYFRLLLNHSDSINDVVNSPSTSSGLPRRGLLPQSSSIDSPILDSPTTHLQNPPNSFAPGSHGISSSALSPGYYRKFFVEEAELGRGGRGQVLLVRHVLDGVTLGYFACKRVPVGDDHEWLEKVLSEVQLLQNLSHQNLVSYRHVWLEDYQLNAFGPCIPCAFILQQYCNMGDLLHYILNISKDDKMSKWEMKERLRRKRDYRKSAIGSSNPTIKYPINPSTTSGTNTSSIETPRTLSQNARLISFEEIFSFFKDITAGLHHLHSNGYIHRDLKPSNCLLHRSGNKLRVLVSDFGEAQMASMRRKSTGATGTVSYCAPEVLQKNSNGDFGNFTPSSDIFSLGMIVYFMCFATLPYVYADNTEQRNEDTELLRDEITRWSGFNALDKQLRPELPDQLYKFLSMLLSLDPNQRPETGKILHGIKAVATGSTVNMSVDFHSDDDFENSASRTRVENMTTVNESGLDYTRSATLSEAQGDTYAGMTPLSTFSPSSSSLSSSSNFQDSHATSPMQIELLVKSPSRNKFTSYALSGPVKPAHNSTHSSSASKSSKLLPQSEIVSHEFYSPDTRQGSCPRATSTHSQNEDSSQLNSHVNVKHNDNKSGLSLHSRRMANKSKGSQGKISKAGRINCSTTPAKAASALEACQSTLTSKSKTSSHSVNREKKSQVSNSGVISSLSQPNEHICDRHPIRTNLPLIVVLFSLKLFMLILTFFMLQAVVFGIYSPLSLRQIPISCKLIWQKSVAAIHQLAEELGTWRLLSLFCQFIIPLAFVDYIISQGLYHSLSRQ